MCIQYAYCGYYYYFMSIRSSKNFLLPLIIQNFFHINKLSLLPWLLWQKRFLALKPWDDMIKLTRPILLYCRPWAKKAPNSFAIVNKQSSKILYIQKKFWGQWHFKIWLMYKVKSSQSNCALILSILQVETNNLILVMPFSMLVRFLM